MRTCSTTFTDSCTHSYDLSVQLSCRDSSLSLSALCSYTCSHCVRVVQGGTAVITGTAVAVFRQQWVINPRQVYDLAMLQLSRDPAAVNVLGLPMVGSEMRACLQTGGGFRFKVRPCH